MTDTKATMLTVRISATEARLIDRAAEALGTTRSGFVRGVVTDVAETVLLAQQRRSDEVDRAAETKR